MSFRAQLVTSRGLVRPFEWRSADAESTGAHRQFYIVDGGAPGARVPADPGTGAATEDRSGDQDARLAALEREAFSKGYAAGERAGLEVGARRADAMLRRLAETLDQLGQLRATIVRQTERQVVELALTLARRVVTRELSLDPQLVAALAHVALQRLGDQAPATIRLHPDDYAAIVAQRGAQWEGAQVTVVADPAVSRGGCTVESEFGVVDASVDAQFAELSRELLGEDEPRGESHEP